MRTYRNILFSFWILCLFLTACDTSKRPDTKGIKEEMATREVKKISDAEIMVRGETLGMALLDTVEKVFKTALLTAIQQEGIPGAISYCNLNASELVSGIQDSLQVSIKRVTDKPRNPMDALSGIEKEIFEAYAFDPTSASSQIQEIDKRTLILTKPIKISNGLCLNCHGKVGQQISEKNYKLIQSLYPEDQAINYDMGDLRGMWSLRIPVSTVVNQL